MIHDDDGSIRQRSSRLAIKPDLPFSPSVYLLFYIDIPPPFPQSRGPLSSHWSSSLPSSLSPLPLSRPKNYKYYMSLLLLSYISFKSHHPGPFFFSLSLCSLSLSKSLSSSTCSNRSNS